MGDETPRQGLDQQLADDQRRQAGQQNQQGQQGQRQDNDDLSQATPDPLDEGLEGGVDTGAIQPADTGQR
jgi:hypothetical protein